MVIVKTGDLGAHYGGVVRLRLTRASGETGITKVLTCSEQLSEYTEKVMAEQKIAVAEFLTAFLLPEVAAFGGDVIARWELVA